MIWIPATEELREKTKWTDQRARGNRKMMLIATQVEDGIKLLF